MANKICQRIYEDSSSSPIFEYDLGSSDPYDLVLTNQGRFFLKVNGERFVGMGNVSMGAYKLIWDAGLGVRDFLNASARLFYDVVSPNSNPRTEVRAFDLVNGVDVFPFNDSLTEYLATTDVEGLHSLLVRTPYFDAKIAGKGLGRSYDSRRISLKVEADFAREKAGFIAETGGVDFSSKEMVELEKALSKLLARKRK